MIVNMYRPVSRRALNGNGFNGLLDGVLNDFFAPAANRAEGDKAAVPVTLARFDVVEKADRFEAFIDLPGAQKDDIEVQIEGSQVTVKAEPKATEALKEGERVLYASRLSGKFSRSFELPSEVSDANAEASFENGVLKLVLPKKAVVQPKRVAIK